MRQFTFVVDLDRCIGCMQCMTACEMQESAQIEQSRINIYRIAPSSENTSANNGMYFLPVMCQQCKNPACVKICKTNALYKNLVDGLVCYDRSLCTGCLDCVDACPYHAINYRDQNAFIDKCFLCKESYLNGGEPACVTACDCNALLIGNTDDPLSHVSQALKEAGGCSVFTLKDEHNCQPSIRYILRETDWDSELPKELRPIKYNCNDESSNETNKQ